MSAAPSSDRLESLRKELEHMFAVADGGYMVTPRMVRKALEILPAPEAQEHTAHAATA